jgi:hypothetical protein
MLITSVEGITISKPVVKQLLRKHDYVKRKAQKRLSTDEHQERNARFFVSNCFAHGVVPVHQSGLRVSLAFKAKKPVRKGHGKIVGSPYPWWINSQ